MTNAPPLEFGKRFRDSDLLLHSVQPAELRAIEKMLADHPGVHSASVVIRELATGQRGLVAYVVPDDSYIERTFVTEIDDKRRSEQWRKIYDLYQIPKAGGGVESGLSARVWHSAYTKRPIPENEMQEWLGCALDRVRQLQPARIFEIGCGLGALLFPLAPTCERYVGSDISGASISSLKNRIAAAPGNWESVALVERGADNFEGLDTGSFDTVLINSVTMYFPSVKYLTKVLQGAMQLVHPKGAIFVGDNRSLPLLTTFAVSVETFQAPAGLPLNELRLRIQKRLKLEKEMFISPSYFLALQKKHPEISYVEILPKRGKFDNELNRFRYDVVLWIGGSIRANIEAPWRDWSRDQLTIEMVHEMLRHRPERLAIRGIQNSRIERDNRALEIVVGQDAPPPSIDQMRDALVNAPLRGAHPEIMFALADEFGYRMSFSWAGTRADGSYDVIFRRCDQVDRENLSAVSWPQPVSLSDNLAHHVVEPVRIEHRRELGRQLRDFASQKVNNHMVPADFVLLDAIPMAGTGSIDYNALPPPWLAGF